MEFKSKSPFLESLISKIAKLGPRLDLRSRKSPRPGQKPRQAIGTNAPPPPHPVGGNNPSPLAAPHVYQALESLRETRIVLLSPGRKDSPIQCILHVNLNSADAPTYEALSYEWGAPSDDDPTIYLDSYPVRIRANLFHALKHIREPSGAPQALWIDSLSVDQTNISERGHQVQLMSAIYKQASSVIVWLGLARHNSDEAMRLFAEPKTPSLTPEQRSAIEALCKRSYWRRVWIQQELYLARTYTIRCGKHSVPEAAFDWNVVAFYANHEANTSPARDIIVRRELRWANRLRMWINLAYNQGLQTSEPHDYVYGMLGVSNDCKEGEIVPDYEKPLVDLYFEVLAFCRDDVVYGGGFERRFAANLGLLEDERVKAVVEEKEKEEEAKEEEAEAKMEEEETKTKERGGEERDEEKE